MHRNRKLRLVVEALVVKEKEDDNYRPYDTLKAIGFTKDEAKGFLTTIEQAAATQLRPEPKKVPDMELKFRTQKTELRRSRLKNFLLIVAGYAVAVWIYVVAVQFVHPEWIYAPFASWLPIRMDYVGEAAFVVSFMIITVVTMWNSKRIMRPKLREAEPDPQAPS